MTLSTTAQRLRDLSLPGMADALVRQSTSPVVMEMSFEARLDSLIDAEVDGRERRRLERILKSAHLRFKAMPEAIDYRADRGLNRDLLLDVLSLNWLDKNRNGIIEGACGAGKTFLACAIGMQAARNGVTVQYHHLFEIVEARTGKASTIIIGQLPVEHWHGFLEDPPLADAILDRLVHKAFRLEVQGESMRKLSDE